jgi:erythromycin esterase-like protein
MTQAAQDRIDLLEARIVPLTDRESDYDTLIESVGDRRFVLLGEASHGSRDFYRERARITKRLITEKGFTAVAVEADWPDAYRVNRFVLGLGRDRDASEALADFERFPSWMWRNTEVVDFIAWLRAHNASSTDSSHPVRFYGLDLYSLRASMQAVLAYLDAVDPEAASSARQRYSCFDHVQGEGPEYGHAVTLDLIVPCENEVVAELVDLRRRAASLLAHDGWAAQDEYFFAEQNAQLIRNAERYYRSMYRGHIASWNLRDEHMAETLGNLTAHLDRQVGRAKIVVWEHNSHIGDARATDMGAAGEFNVGELVRTAWGDQCLLVGFTTDHGEVTAASEWGGPAERKVVRPALRGSYEELFHGLPTKRFFLPLGPDSPPLLQGPRLERAIGVIYRPETERVSHWFHASLPAQFDAVVHLDRTTAVEPLERTALWDEGEAPETYPTGL